jgi:O-acetyl-ADP-ribose deacetylase (regulator of RNase III)
MIRLIQGNLLNSNCNYICHQVNCQGVMEVGIAKQIRKKWPQVYKEYSNKCNTFGNKMLGRILAVYIDEGQKIVNLFGQDKYGTDKIYTDYEALERCFKNLHAITNERDTIGIPYRMGCGLVGGDWPRVVSLIEKYLSDRKVYIYKLYIGD